MYGVFSSAVELSHCSCIPLTWSDLCDKDMHHSVSQCSSGEAVSTLNVYRSSMTYEAMKLKYQGVANVDTT